ncbi:MAG: hypothetical protein ABGY95_08410, partial [Rubritalea sp.]
ETAADDVWCTYITYIPMPRGHSYLIAVRDWHTRAVLSWEVCNTMDTAFFSELYAKPSSLQVGSLRSSTPIKIANGAVKNGWEKLNLEGSKWTWTAKDVGETTCSSYASCGVSSMRNSDSGAIATYQN